MTIDGCNYELSVAKKYRRNFRISKSGRLVCLNCERLMKTKDGKSLEVRAVTGDPSTITVPLMYTKPHVCLYSTLKAIDDLKTRKLFHPSLCDEWFSLNGSAYQLGNSSECMKLWEEFNKMKCSRVQSQHYVNIDWSKEQQAVEFGKCRHHKGLYVKILWAKLKNKDDLRILNEVWRWSSDADHAKTNVSAADMIWHMRTRDWCRALYDRWNIMFSTNLYNITACALLIHLVGNPTAIKVFKLLEERKFCCIDLDDYKNVFKALSVAIRRTGYWPDGTDASLDEVTGCASWELAVGRSMNRSDWEEERQKRTEVRIPLGSPLLERKSDDSNNVYCHQLRFILVDIMSELVGRPPNRDSWAEYVENRQSWCSSGSTGGKRFKLSTKENVRLNKHAYFETLQVTEMVEWLESEPMMLATASEKFEMGKARAIYGTQPVDYSIASYVLDNIESRLYNINGVESGLVGQDFIATMIRRCAAVEKEGTECTMIDYADFNYQHTLLAQSIVFDVLADALVRRGYHMDKVRACRWVRDAMMNQKCIFPGPDRTRWNITQGMFSGCRGTNFINTILNTAYFRMAKSWVESELRVEPIDLHNIHQGDDVWISNKSRLWALTTFEVMKATGFIFQPSKQMFDVCRGEFLRVVYTDSGCKGYIGRAIGTLIMKPIQGTDVTSPAERAVALNSQIMILKRRGMTDRACELVWDAIVPYSARSKLPNGALTIPVSYLNKSYLDNGLDLGYPGTAASHSREVKSIPIMELGSAILEQEIPDLMARDWANVLSRSLRSTIKYDDLVKSLHKANVTDSLRNEDRMMSLRALEKRLREWLADLDCGTVQRNRKLYDELKLGDRALGKFPSIVRDLCDNLFGKLTPKEHGLMDTIMRGVGSSPFKSVNNAMIATGKGTVEAAEIALLACTNSMTRTHALEAFNRIRTRCGEEITVHLLHGIRAGATKYECEFHPTVLSWVQEIAMNVTVSRATNEGERKLANLLLKVAADFDEHVRVLRDMAKIVRISQY